MNQLSYYLKVGKLKVTPLEGGDVWLDTGTIDSLSDATDFVSMLQEQAEALKKSGYVNYLLIAGQ